jgi:hypothetical protein
MKRYWYYILLALVVIGAITVVEKVTTKLAVIINSRFPGLF